MAESEPHLHLRMALPTDCDAVAAIDAHCFHQPIGADGIWSLIYSFVQHLYVATANGTVVGFAVAEGASMPIVLRVAVPSAIQFWDGEPVPMRRRGIGSALLDFAQGQQERLTAHVSEQDPDAKLFMEAVGFVAVGEVRFPDGRYYIMARSRAGRTSPLQQDSGQRGPADSTAQPKWHNRVARYYADKDRRFPGEPPQR